ncbi:MAG: response regulator [Lachnospiraceae bacterium]|nr:response regulator [Lachnospiraceae bacterium]
MFGQLFGRYLVEKSVIKEDAYRMILDKQLSVRVKLGTIAVADGLLTEEQVEEINSLQRQLDKRFGDIAIEKGLLTQDQMEGLLSKQGDSYMQFVQLLTETTGLNTKDVDMLLKAFQKDSGFSDDELEALKSDDIDRLMPLFVVTSKPYIRELASLVVRNIMRFVTRDYYIGKASHVKELPYAHLAYQELAGDASVFVAVAEESDNGGFLRVANGFSHSEMDHVTYDVYDAVGEFINVTAGIFATELSKNGTNVDMEPPLGFKGQKAVGDFYVLPLYIEDKRTDLIIAVNSDFTAGETPESAGKTTFIQSAVSGDAKAKILIVDDSRMSRIMLRNILENAGYAVVGEASDGEEGVEAYSECKPDVVTLDITMPKKDGLEALEAILAVDPDAKAIMITAAGQQDKLIKALKVGAKRFINKPFKEDEILTNIQDVLK